MEWILSREVTSWDFNKLLTQITGNVGNVGNALGKVVNATTSAFGVAMNVMMGFIIAIYVLLSKVSLTRQCKKMIYAHLSKNHADKICYISSLVNETYSKFFSGPPAIRKPDCRTDSNPFLYSIHWSICFLLYWSIAHCNGRSVEGAVEHCRISGRSVY